MKKFNENKGCEIFPKCLVRTGEKRSIYLNIRVFFISNPTFENHSKLLATREPKIGNS